MGIFNGQSCDEYVRQASAAARETCHIAATLVAAGRIDGNQLLCACKLSGCLLGVTQTSSFTDMTLCDSTTNVSQTTSADFVNNLRAELTRTNSDLGQLMQNGKDSVFMSAVNDFATSISDTMNVNVLSQIKSGNSAVVGCGATAANLTQNSQYSVVLSAIQSNTAAQSALSRMSTQADAHIAVTNKGLLGGLWDLFSNLFSSPLFMIAIIIVCCIVAYVLYQKLVGGSGGGGGQPNIIYVQPQQAPNNQRNS